MSTKKILIIPVLLLCVLSLLGAENRKKSKNAVPAEYINIRVSEASSQMDAAAIDSYLKTRLVQSPFFDLRVTEPDIMIHGNLNSTGSLYHLTVFVTDFEENKELQAASVKLLSLSSFEFAIEQIVVQLEGREAVITGKSQLTLKTDKLSDVNVKMPKIRGLDKRKKEMAALLEKQLKEGEYLLSQRKFPEAEEYFQAYMLKFETSLTDEYQDAMEKYYELAEELYEKSIELGVVASITADSSEAEALVLAGSFEQAYLLYEKMIERLDDIDCSDDCDKLKETLEETHEELAEVSEAYIKALYDELEFNLSFYGFQDDPQGVENSFSVFYQYADESLYLSDYDGEYEDLRELYLERFPSLIIPSLDS